MTEPLVGLNIRGEANSRSPKLGLLPRGARVEIGERSRDGRWGKIARVIEGSIAPVRQGQPVDPAASTGWLFLGELEPDTGAPEAFDSVVKVDPPRAIRAGALIGHIGEYQRFEDAKPIAERSRRPLLHVEVFSGEDVPAFVARSRTYAQTLPASARTLLVIEAGAKLVQPGPPDASIAAGERVVAAADSPAAGRWAKGRRGAVQVAERAALGAYTTATRTYANGAIFTGWYVGGTPEGRTQNEAEATQRHYTKREVMMPSGPPLWVERAGLGAEGAAAARPAWTQFPLQVARASAPEAGFTHVVGRAELEALKPEDQAVDAQGKKWWRLQVTSAASEGARRSIGAGWVREADHPKVSWQSPWAWPGFELVDEGEVKPVDLMSRRLLNAGEVLGREQGDFKARADKVEGSALITKIYEQIDVNGDGQLDAQELRAAMRQPPLARALSRIIARYESEWGGEMAKWDALDPLMLDASGEWRAEKGRIAALRWWPDVVGKAEGFPADPTVHHIHPIALIANFFGDSGGCPNCKAAITAAQLKEIFPSAADAKINDVMAVFNEASEKFDLVKCRRKAHFFAQVREEVGPSIQALSENLNYAATALGGLFSYFGRHPAEAQQYGRTANHAADQAAIANRAYGGRGGNGDVASGDGWRFRGRGYLQLTLRGNYQAVQTEMDTRFAGNGLNIMTNPDEILAPRGGMMSAMGFWTHNSLNAVADRGESGDHVDAVTRIINLHTHSYAERRTHFTTTQRVFKLSECTDGRQGAAPAAAAR